MKITLSFPKAGRILNSVIAITLGGSAWTATAATKNVWIESPADTRDSAGRYYCAVPSTVQFTARTDWPEGESWTWYGATRQGASTNTPSVATDEFLDPEGPCTVTAVYHGEVSYAVIVYACKIDSTTVATTPSDRKRLTVGVAEEVTLAILPSSVGSVNWDIWSGTGLLSSTTGSSVTFTAPETGQNTTIIAYNSVGLECFKPFDIIPPSSVNMQRNSSYGVWHTNGIAGVGIITSIWIGPDYVSFYRVACKEGQTWGTANGYLSYLEGYPHDEGFPIYAWDQVDPGCGTKLAGLDRVQGGADNHASYSDGQFVWPIPWDYVVSGSSTWHYFTTVNEVMTITPTGKFTVSKAGASESREVNDPSSDY